MATKQKDGGDLPLRRLLSPPSKPVGGHTPGRTTPEDNRGHRLASSATGAALKRRSKLAKPKLKVGLTFVLGQTTDDVLAKSAEGHKWSRNGLVPRGKLKLKLTKRQHKAVQTPSYLR